MLKKPYTAGWIATGIFLAIFSGIVWIGQVQLAQADGHGRVYDGRYGHNHYYPARGVYVNAVPGVTESCLTGVSIITMQEGCGIVRTEVVS